MKDQLNHLVINHRKRSLYFFDFMHIGKRQEGGYMLGIQECPLHYERVNETTEGETWARGCTPMGQTERDSIDRDWWRQAWEAHPPVIKQGTRAVGRAEVNSIPTFNRDNRVGFQKQDIH